MLFCVVVFLLSLVCLFVCLLFASSCDGYSLLSVVYWFTVFVSPICLAAKAGASAHVIQWVHVVRKLVRLPWGSLVGIGCKSLVVISTFVKVIEYSIARVHIVVQQCVLYVSALRYPPHLPL